MKNNTNQIPKILGIVSLILLFTTKAFTQETTTLYLWTSVNTQDNKSIVISPTIAVQVKKDDINTRTILFAQFKDYFKKFVAGEMGIKINVQNFGEGPSESRKLVEEKRLNWLRKAREYDNKEVINSSAHFNFRYEDPNDK